MTLLQKISAPLFLLFSTAGAQQVCDPAQGTGQCGFLGAGGVLYNSTAEAYASYQQPYNTYVEPEPMYIPPPPPPTHHCTAREEGGELCADTRPGLAGNSYSTNAAGEFDDLMVSSYPDGTPRIITNFHNGKKEGKSSFFYPDGTIESVMYYQNDELNGAVQSYHPNGTLKHDMTYCNGEACGEERDYDEQGNLVRIIRFDANGDAESVQEITPGSQAHGTAKKSRKKS
ncbi:hypothetical protein CHUV0807_2127 [Cardiobacterium hominis]|uniref:MORN repeat protein n=1 Tax=Cardiobacterium hominis TaxID=2718 RepID=A0A1C3H6B1_9GAMM|nr:toxin-antitoxin system YwqK family antitoxin [Cardiobacterium hominis]SAM69996.1 hypothetical protein CHUV0807_2127 [Cardiobacterium hominis]